MVHVVIPILGFLSNLGMLLAIFYLGILGGGATRTAALIAIISAIVWTVFGVMYLISNSKATSQKIVAKV